MTSSLHQFRPCQPHPKTITHPQTPSAASLSSSPPTPSSSPQTPKLSLPGSHCLHPHRAPHGGPPTSPLWGHAAPEPYPASHSLTLAGNQASDAPSSTSAVFILWPLPSSYPAPPSTTHCHSLSDSTFFSHPSLLTVLPLLPLPRLTSLPLPFLPG